MIQRSIKRLSLRALIVDDELPEPTAEGRATRALVQELQGRGIEVVEAASADDAMSVVVSDSSIPIDVMQMVNEYIWTLEDAPALVGGRVAAAMGRYLQVLLPPLAAALMRFGQTYEYSWHTPGHTGGTAFLKSPVGRMFLDYFGENLLRSDLSITVGDLGSLLDHAGPIGDHERY